MGIVRTGIVQRTVPNGGRKLYASKIMYSNVGHDELISYMQRNANIGRATAVAAVDVFVKVFQAWVMNGHAIRVPELGTFSLSAKTKSVASRGKADASVIRRRRVRFTPLKHLKESARSTRFQGIVVDDDTATPEP